MARKGWLWSPYTSMIRNFRAERMLTTLNGLGAFKPLAFEPDNWVSLTQRWAQQFAHRKKSLPREAV